MIAKKAARRGDGKGSFGTLARYILGEAAGREHVQFAKATNCEFDDVDLAIKEIAATQALNTRSADKTYHLIVSFRAGERPTPAQLEDIEETLCGAIGLAGHQRLSATHEDTDNLHLHIAINKVHPKTLRMARPYNDYRALSDACAGLERRHGLERDNHMGDRDREHIPLPTPAADMAAHAGRQPFCEWIAEQGTHLRSAAAHADGWTALHTALADFDLTIRPRGAGLVVTTRDGTAAVKASAIGREFALGALSNRFGDYQPAPHDHVSAVSTAKYRAAPLHADPTKSGLWERYQASRRQALERKRPLLQRIRFQRERAIDAVRAEFNAKRAAVKGDLVMSRRQKRDVYQRLAIQRRSAYASIRADALRAVAKAHEAHPLKTWQSWLMDRAVEGDGRALAALRSRARTRGAEAFCLAGHGDAADAIPELKPTVRANGDVLYKVDDVQIRDTGGRIALNAAKPAAVRTALELASRRWGRALAVTGDALFREVAAAAAGASRLKVAFDDPELERRRRLVSSLTAAERSEHAAIEDWIHQRNQTRARTADHVPMRQRRAGERGLGAYAGIRAIGGGVNVALVELDGEIAVLRVSERQALRFKKHRIGHPLSFDRRGRCEFGRALGR